MLPAGIEGAWRKAVDNLEKALATRYVGRARTASRT